MIPQISVTQSPGFASICLSATPGSPSNRSGWVLAKPPRKLGVGSPEQDCPSATVGCGRTSLDTGPQFWTVAPSRIYELERGA